MLKASMELPAGDEFSGRDRRDERQSSLLLSSSHFVPLTIRSIRGGRGEARVEATSRAASFV